MGKNGGAKDGKKKTKIIEEMNGRDGKDPVGSPRGERKGVRLG